MRAWYFTKEEFKAIFREFHKTGCLDWRLNTTFITLILKIEGEKEIFYLFLADKFIEWCIQVTGEDIGKKI